MITVTADFHSKFLRIFNEFFYEIVFYVPKIFFNVFYYILFLLCQKLKIQPKPKDVVQNIDNPFYLSHSVCICIKSRNHRKHLIQLIKFSSKNYKTWIKFFLKGKIFNGKHLFCNRSSCILKSVKFTFTYHLLLFYERMCWIENALKIINKLSVQLYEAVF